LLWDFASVGLVLRAQSLVRHAENDVARNGPFKALKHLAVERNYFRLHFLWMGAFPRNSYNRWILGTSLASILWRARKLLRSNIARPRRQRKAPGARILNRGL